MGLPAAYVPKRDASPQRACFAKGYRAPKHTPQASFAPRGGIVQDGGTAFRPTPSAPADKPTVMRSDVSVPRTSIGDGGELATRTSYRAPTTTVRQAIPGKGMVAIPAPAPQLPPPVTSKSTDLGGGEAQAPAPFLPTTPMIGLAADPNPFAPYCGPDNELTPASALCRAASDAGLSDDCRQQLLAFLGSKSSQTLGSWIAAQELCDQAALRRAVGIAEASMAAKTSAGLFDKPSFGNPFGVDGYAWKQDRVRKPSPFAYHGDGSTMDYRSPSGGMPNYYRASSGLAEDIAALGAGTAAQGSMTFTESEAADILGGNGMTAAEKGRLTAAQTADAFARGRDNPPTDYGRIIGSIGTAVGGVLAGINQAVDQAENRRIRELEVNYANNARGRELALRERGQELAGEIARLRAAPSAATDPAMATLIQRLEQQGAEYRSAIQRLETESQGMGTGTAVALGVGAVAVLGLGAFVLMGKRRR